MKNNWIMSPDNKVICPEFERSYSIDKKPVRATLCATAMGFYEAYINGKRVGNERFTPGWTEYKSRVQFQQYDVTDMMDSEITLKLCLAPGWAGSKMGWSENEAFTDHLSVSACLELTYDNGESKRLFTDEGYRVYSSTVVNSQIYDGEIVDYTAKRRLLGNALHDESVCAAIVPQQGERIIEQERIAPVKIIVTPKGERVVDFGQNMTGYAVITLTGNRNDKIVIDHAEVLDSDGNFYTENLRGARQRCEYTLCGGKQTIYPRFDFQGFRYIRLTEFPDSINIDDVAFTAVAVYSEIRRTSDFICGNTLLNRLYENTLWGQRSNYLDVPTDCPQRDERLGWTGDAQVFVRAAAINFDVKRFFNKWLDDMAIAQLPDGGIPNVIPNCLRGVNVSAAWGDAAVICPWQIYLAYGDKALLKKNFPMMKRYVDYIHNVGDEEYLWLGGKHFGDWLALDNDDPQDRTGATDKDYLASAFFAYSTQLLVNAGHELEIDVSEYERLLENIKIRFAERFLQDGLPKKVTQTSLVLALYFGLTNNPEKAAAALCEQIKADGNHLTTGFVGTPYLLHSLSQNGYTKLAYDLLLREKYPSWLYPVTRGATTMWEHWDSIREDGSMWFSNMNSFNHYAYGAVVDWIFGVAAGITPLCAGYKRVKIAPVPDKRLGYMCAHINTVQGNIVSQWRYENGQVRYNITVPNGVEAEIYIGDSRYTVNGGSYIYYTE